MPSRRSISLALSLAALLAVAAVSAWAVWRNTREAQSRIALLHQRELTSQKALADVRSGVYLIAILTRDSLLDTGRSTSQDYITQFDSIKNQTEASIRILDAVALEDAPAMALRQLVAELDGYWDSTLGILRSNPQTPRAVLLQGRVARRLEILRLAQRIEELTEDNATQEQTRISEADQYFRSSLAWTSGVSLLLGLGISGFALSRMRMLEQQSEASESTLRLLSGQLRTAQEQERKALSRELHDQVGQMLTGLRMELSALEQPGAATENEIRTGFSRAKATVEQALAIVRNIAMLLRPSMLDDFGLTPALKWLAKEVSRSSRMEIRCDIDARVDRLPDAHRTCLFRVVQEALTNASRHSGARTVELNVGASDGYVRVKVTDDGKGFDTAAERGKGLGLLGMQERVRELGGELHISSIPGRGTTIEIRLPQPITMEALDDKSFDHRRPRDREDRIKTAL